MIHSALCQQIADQVGNDNALVEHALALCQQIADQVGNDNTLVEHALALCQRIADQVGNDNSVVDNSICFFEFSSRTPFLCFSVQHPHE